MTCTRDDGHNHSVIDSVIPANVDDCSNAEYFTNSNSVIDGVIPSVNVADFSNAQYFSNRYSVFWFLQISTIAQMQGISQTMMGGQMMMQWSFSAGYLVNLRYKGLKLDWFLMIPASTSRQHRYLTSVVLRTVAVQINMLNSSIVTAKNCNYDFG